jgi:hypothetical protein
MNRPIRLFLAAAAFFLFLPSTAFAAGDGSDGLQLSATTATFVVATLIPVAVGFLTRLDSRYKGPLMLVLNAINTLVTTALLEDGTALISQPMLTTFVTGLIGSLAMYYGVWKPLGVTSSAVQVPGSSPGGTKSIPGKLSDKGVH